VTEPSPSRSELVEALALATSAAVTELFREYPAHHFYYCSLITTGEALAPEGRKPKADPMAKRTPGIPGPSACHEPFGPFGS
jgi:hypothetical protein